MGASFPILISKLIGCAETYQKSRYESGVDWEDLPRGGGLKLISDLVHGAEEANI